MVMTTVPRAIASLANFERIQNYLLTAGRQDCRLNMDSIRRQPSDLISNSIEHLTRGSSVLVEKVIVQFASSSEPFLRDIDLEMTSGSITMCSGSVGSGKTTLAKLILGEVSPSSGSVHATTRGMGFCSQQPWIPSGTIKDVICEGFKKSDFDSIWYETVLYTCDLLHDLKELPEGDETQVGSRGLNLSGGQRQRVVSYLPLCHHIRPLN